MQLNLDRDDLTGDVQVVIDPRGGYGVALLLCRAGGEGPNVDQGSNEVWGTLTIFGDVRGLLRKAAVALDLAMGEPAGLSAAQALLEALPPGTLGYVPSAVPPYKEDALPFAIRGIKATIAKTRGT